MASATLNLHLLNLLFKIVIIYSLMPISIVIADEQVKEVKKFTVGVEDLSFYPLYGRHEEKTLPYFDYLIKEFSFHSGYQFTIKLLPVKRLKAFLANGQVDFIFPSNALWNKDPHIKDILRSNPVIYDNSFNLVTLKNQMISVDEVHSFGALLGFTSVYWLDILKKRKINRLEFSDSKSLVRALLRGRINAAELSSAAARYQLSQLNASNEAVTSTNLPSMRINLSMATIKYKKVMVEFDKFLNNRRYFLTDVKKNMGIYEFSEPVGDELKALKN